MTPVFCVFVSEEKSYCQVPGLFPNLNHSTKIIVCNACLLYAFNSPSRDHLIKKEKCNVKVENDQELTSNYSKQHECHI